MREWVAMLRPREVPVVEEGTILVMAPVMMTLMREPAITMGTMTRHRKNSMLSVKCGGEGVGEVGGEGVEEVGGEGMGRWVVRDDKVSGNGMGRWVVREWGRWVVRGWGGGW